MAKACLVNLENIINNKPLKAVYSVDKQPFLPVSLSLSLSLSPSLPLSLTHTRRLYLGEDVRFKS